MQSFTYRGSLIPKLLAVCATTAFLAGCDILDSDGFNFDSDGPGAGNEAPEITSDGSGNTADISVPENETAVTAVTYDDADGVIATFSLAGNDATEFTISDNGALAFASAPDFASPTDDDMDNVYEVTVTVADGNGGTDSQEILVTVTMAPIAEITTDNTLRISRAILGAILVPEPIPPYCDVFGTDPACAGGAVATAAAANEPGPLLAQASAFEETLTIECDADNDPNTPYNPDDGFVEIFTSYTNDPDAFDPVTFEPLFRPAAGDIYRSTASNCNNAGELITNGTSETETLSYTPGASLNEYTQTDRTTTTDNSITWPSLSWDPARSLTLTSNDLQNTTTSSINSVVDFSATINGIRKISDGRTIVFEDILVSVKNDFTTPPVWPITQISEFGFDGDVSHTDFGFEGFVSILSIGPWLQKTIDTRPAQNDPNDPLEAGDLQSSFDGTVRIFIEGGGYVDGTANGDSIQLEISEDGMTVTGTQNYTQEELFYGDLLNPN